MVDLPGGTVLMGSTRFYPEERPLRRAVVAPFRIDVGPVTNRQFAAFVAATGHVTVAERRPDPADYPGLRPHQAVAGSLVFRPPPRAVPLDDWSAWWAFVPGACWRRPTGPGSGLKGLGDHPVVHVAHADAVAFAAWAGKALPSEAEWEYAARGGLEGQDFAWGNALAPGGAILANYWHGPFPHRNLSPDGWVRTSPVGQYPPNGFGLHDMIGNVWEWTDDWYALPDAAGSDCCGRGGEAASFDPALPDIRIGRKVLKGGSHLCAESYCQRYRPAARIPQAVDSATSHIGFRCVVRGNAASGP